MAAERGAVIAMSYSEPSLAPEFTLALASWARPAGVDIVWKTNGFVNQSVLERLVQPLTAVNLDLKASSDRSHFKLTGAPLQPVLSTLRYLAASHVWLEVSTPVIPGVNDDSESLEQVAELVVGAGAQIPWHLLRFTPEYRMGNFCPTHPDKLAEAVRIAKRVGLKYVYVERALGPAGRNTVCPSCEATIITRGVWTLDVDSLSSGHCPECGFRIPGHW